MYICKLLTLVPAATSSLFPALCATDTTAPSPELVLARDAAPLGPPLAWKTAASPYGCDHDLSYLTSAGTRGDFGQSCLSVAPGVPSMIYLDYALGDNMCAITLRGERQ